MKRSELVTESSMLNWYTKIVGTVPTPETVMIPIRWPDILSIFDNEPLDPHLVERLKTAARDIGYPIFLRTDQASGKHEWANTCYVPNEDVLIQHVYNLIEWHECADMLGIRFDAIVLRKFLPLASLFYAFRDMPVSVERRFFVKDGAVICWYPYWPEDAIRGRNLPGDWKDRLAHMNTPEQGEIEHLSKLAEAFSVAVPGYWSVDFARTIAGQWVLIDAARGEISWHPADCEARL